MVSAVKERTVTRQWLKGILGQKGLFCVFKWQRYETYCAQDCVSENAEDLEGRWAMLFLKEAERVAVERGL